MHTNAALGVLLYWVIGYIIDEALIKSRCI